ncbi:hypothetical protein ACOMHN_061085 [Nucella lapillus]
MTNTPIHPWNVPGAPADFSVSVKRDDLTGCAVTGNKVRKLEFLMAEAVEQGCRHVITCGSIMSNHCRAVAVCARQLGMTPHLLLCTDAKDMKGCGIKGNMLLNHLCGANMYLVPRDCHIAPRMEQLAQHIHLCVLVNRVWGANIYLVPKYCPYLTHMAPRMEQLAQHIQSTRGESSCLIPNGGSNMVGIFGYLTAFEELRQQGVMEQYDDLVFACSGGVAGWAIGNYLTGSHLKLHGICLSQDAAHYYQVVEESLEALGLGHLKARDLLRVVDQYKGRGYGLSTQEELEFIHQVAMKTSVVLDPVYTGKATLGMVTEMNNHPDAFKGRRVLYIHTGGMFGLFDGRMTPFLEEKEERQPCVKMWPTLDDSPL